jgi:hypothetical protein
MNGSEQVRLFLTHADIITDLLTREEGALSDNDLNLLKTKLNVMEIKVKSLQTIRYLSRSDEAA